METTVRVMTFILSEIGSHLTSVGEDVVNGETFLIVNGNVNWCSYYGKQ